MNRHLPRRLFLKKTAGLSAGLGLLYLGCGRAEEVDETLPGDEAPRAEAAAPLFKISLAQWSLHKSIFSVDPAEMGYEEFARRLHGDDYRSLLGGEIDPLDFPRVARQEFGIDGVEYVNTFYFDRARDEAYLTELRNRCDSEGVTSLLIMCDAEGELGHPDAAQRQQAVENHHKWVDAAAFLGCHSIRVNAQSDPSLPLDEQQQLAADGLRSLCEYADGQNINVIVENHGGPSSNAQWLVGVMELVDHPRVGTLPDFGNFCVRFEGTPWLSPCAEPYDRYQGVEELMPYAKGVSAKTHQFDAEGNETDTDYLRMMKIVLDAGYHGYVGIEYEGPELSEMEGIRATKALLERVRNELAPEYA